jgi:hypothetical protein
MFNRLLAGPALLFISLLSAGCGSSGGKETAAAPQPVQQTPTQPQTPQLSLKVPTAANSWVEGNPKETETLIQANGIRNWRRSSDKIVTYLRLGKAGELELALNGKVLSGTSAIEVSVGGSSKRIELSNTTLQQVYVGKFAVSQPGYQKIVLQGVSASADVFADIDDILIGGSAVGSDTYFIKDEFYWGRRGPSVHLNYQSPTSAPLEYFYSELTVPAGQDVIGSYYMANGFGQGYFGIQVNSASERRVLFSVWSPYETDDPNKIPPEDRVQLLRKGPGVQSGEFGNEGSGGQSYLIYPWQAATTYKFLLKAKPVDNNSTDYSAWFYAPEQAQWRLIASFRRPKTQTWLTNQHAFLENFIPEAGQFSREAQYGNGWVRTATGEWLPLQHASFSYDDTARRQSRWDYQGGVKNGRFYLKNGGFFDDFTTFGSKFSRDATVAPVLDLMKLP